MRGSVPASLGTLAASLGDGCFQIANHVGYGPVLRPGNCSHWPTVMPVRLNADGLEQNIGRHMMGMGDEGNAHPGPYRLVLAPDAASVDAGPEAEGKRSGNRQHES